MYSEVTRAMVDIDLVKGLRGWRKWSEQEDIARLMEMAAERIESLEAAGARGRSRMLRTRVRALEDQKEKMLERLRGETERFQSFARLVSDLDPDGPLEELRDQARRLSRRFRD